MLELERKELREGGCGQIQDLPLPFSELEQGI